MNLQSVFRLQQSYRPVKAEETLEDHVATTHTSKVYHYRSRLLTIGVTAVTTLLVILMVITAVISSGQGTSTISVDTSNQSTTQQCNQRREWRSLSSADQQSYITAVKCLLTEPSDIRLSTPNTSAYSDFPYVHAHIGYRTHNSAPFLPWHRYLLHLYERALHTKCGYESGLVYWDWALDAEDLASSPVFDATSGFGGDGAAHGEIIVGKHGRCVIDGPFAGVEALWYDVKYRPHCLSRGFRNDDGAGKMDGRDVSKTSIDQVLKLDTYEQFVRAMEVKIHDTIPFGIGGDFETFSAPFDPLFYLHHVQLDRLWWQWQQKDQRQNLHSYGGHKGRHSVEQADLTDKIDMGSFALAIEVQAVMDTSGGDNMLCYSY